MFIKADKVQALGKAIQTYYLYKFTQQQIGASVMSTISVLSMRNLSLGEMEFISIRGGRLGIKPRFVWVSVPISSPVTKCLFALSL